MQTENHQHISNQRYISTKDKKAQAYIIYMIYKVQSMKYEIWNYEINNKNYKKELTIYINTNSKKYEKKLRKTIDNICKNYIYIYIYIYIYVSVKYEV